MKEKAEKININELFEIMPQSVCIIDKQRNIVLANKSFERHFGKWQNKNLRDVAERLDSIEVNKSIDEAFKTGKTSNTLKTLYDIKGNLNHLVINLVPTRLNGSTEDYLVCIASNIAEANQWQKEFNLLFERVPCYISVVDKELNVVRANEKFRDTFGEGAGTFAFDALRRRRGDTENNPAARTFEDGEEHISTQVGFTLNGDRSHYIISSFPIAYDEEGKPALVMEIGTDITELNKLQEQLHQAHDFYADIIETSEDAILATARKGKLQIFNEAARRMFNWQQQRKPGIPKIKEFMPRQFYDEPDENGIIAKNLELNVKAPGGEEIPVRFNAFELRNKKQSLGKVAFLQDLREIKRLEKGKQTAEREAINHTFSILENNIIKLTNDQQNNLERFEEVLKSGSKSQTDVAWKRLKQKISNSNTIVDRFVKFAKGYKPKFVSTKINEYAAQLLDEYSDVAQDYDIDVVYKVDVRPQELLIDKYSFDTLIRVLMTNAIDNVIDNKHIKGKIEFEISNKDDYMIIRCTDNGFSSEPEELKKYFSDEPGGDAKIGMLTLEIIINLLEGNLTIADGREVGSEFEISIPMK